MSYTLKTTKQYAKQLKKCIKRGPMVLWSDPATVPLYREADTAPADTSYSF